jgi:hypothetical protein
MRLEQGATFFYSEEIVYENEANALATHHLC